MNEALSNKHWHETLCLGQATTRVERKKKNFLNKNVIKKWFSAWRKTWISQTDKPKFQLQGLA